MASAVHCVCICHRSLLGNFRALFHQGRYVEALKLERGITANWDGVDVSSILEAACACPACLDKHCPALEDERKRPRKKDIWIDPPLMYPPPEPLPPPDEANPEE